MRPSRRLVLLAAAVTTSLAIMTPAAHATAAGASTPDLDAGADYLVTNLVDGHYYDPFGGFADYGLTMDGALALAAAGNRDAALQKVVTFLDQRGTDPNDRSVDDYTGIGTAYAAAGSIAKEALVAEATGHDPRRFGGHDLIAALDASVCTRTIENVCAGPGNYRYAASTFAQAIAITAQLRAGDTAGAAKPIAYLLSLQHGSGAFPSVLPGVDSETDSTAMAAMALALVGTAPARAAATRALGWLAGRQAADGGFPGAAGNSVNSAAVAVQALRLDAQHYARAIAAAERFLAARQNGDGGFDVAADVPGSDLRASTQAVGGAVGVPFGSVLDHLPAGAAAADGADYLVDRLADGTHYEATSDGQGVPDYGSTADGVLALVAAGGHAATVTAMTDWLAGSVDAYVDPSGRGSGPRSGAAAKLALVALATGRDPHDFGGADLLDLRVCSAAIAGDVSPCTAAGDFYNASSGVSQSLGVLARNATGAHLTASSAPVVRLHQLQCADGGFSDVLIEPGAKCTSEVDATGYAIQALATVAGTDEWLGAAQAYLQKAQRRDGRFTGAAGVSSLSTALAATGLHTLVAALTSPTADPPQPATTAPIVTYQSALTGLTSLAVAGGGFRISTQTAGADLRASTLAVQATAQRSLLELSGATVRAQPRVPAAAPPAGTTTPSPRSTPTTTDPIRTVPAGVIAATGVETAGHLSLALTLLASGLLLLLVGRRRVAVGRHRARHR